MLPLCNRFLPKNKSELYGKAAEILEIESFVKNYKSGALLIHGPVGIGKTSFVYALAKEIGYEVIELNASDSRNKESVRSILGNSSKQMSLFAKGKIILLDEAECLSGNSDRGAMQEVVKLISESKWPVIITVNDIDSEKISEIKKKCRIVDFGVRDNIKELLVKAAELHSVEYSLEAIDSLARQSGSDVRAAINDFQVLSALTGKLDSVDGLEQRDVTGKIEEALFLVFKSKKLDNVMEVFDNLDMDAKDVLSWLDENLPKEYSSLDLITAYDRLSKADVHLGRIRRRQHWRFLVYAYAMLGPGVALAKCVKSNYSGKYNRSIRGLRIWQLNMKNLKRKEVSEFIATECHVSKKKAFQMYPYLEKALAKAEISN